MTGRPCRGERPSPFRAGRRDETGPPTAADCPGASRAGVLPDRLKSGQTDSDGVRPAGVVGGEWLVVRKPPGSGRRSYVPTTHHEPPATLAPASTNEPEGAVA